MVDVSHTPHTEASQLAQALTHEAAPASLIVVGPAGSGRLDLVRAALDVAGAKPYNIHLLEPEAGKATISIDRVRAACTAMQLTSDGLRVLLIPDADRLLSEISVQALLKTAEDAPRSARIIMTAERPGTMPATLLSRSARHTHVLASIETIAATLQADGASAAEARTLALLSGQSLGRARDMRTAGVFAIVDGLLNLCATQSPWPRKRLHQIADSTKQPDLVASICLDLLRLAANSIALGTETEPRITAYATRAGHPLRIAQADRVLRGVLADTRSLALEPRQACMRLLLCLELPVKGR